MPELALFDPTKKDQSFRVTKQNLPTIENVVLGAIDNPTDPTEKEELAATAKMMGEIAETVQIQPEYAIVAEKFRDRTVVNLFPGALLTAASGLKKGQDHSTRNDALRIFGDVTLLELANATKEEGNKLDVLTANTHQELKDIAKKLAATWREGDQPIVLVGCYKEDIEEFQAALADKGVKAELNHALVLRSI